VRHSFTYLPPKPAPSTRTTDWHNHAACIGHEKTFDDADLRAGERPCPKCCAANAEATKTYKRKAEAA